MAADAAYVVCGLEVSACVCSEPVGHDTPHRCRRLRGYDNQPCQGEWYGEHADMSRNTVVTYPTGATTERAARRQLRALRAGGRP